MIYFNISIYMKIYVSVTRNDLDLLPEPLIQNYFPGIELYPNKIKKANIIISNFKKIKKKIIKRKLLFLKIFLMVSLHHSNLQWPIIQIVLLLEIQLKLTVHSIKQSKIDLKWHGQSEIFRSGSR